MEGWGILCLILWLLCSVICYAIMKSKGYPNDVCLKNGIGGVFLGLIWVVVVLCKGQCPTPTTYSSNEQKVSPIWPVPMCQTQNQSYRNGCDYNVLSKLQPRIK